MRFDLNEAIEKKYFIKTTNQQRLTYKDFDRYLNSLFNAGTGEFEAINEAEYAAHINSGEQAQKAYINLIKFEDLSTKTIYDRDYTIAVYTAIMSNFSEASYTADVFYAAIEEVKKLCAKYNIKPLKYEPFTSDDFELINPIDDTIDIRKVSDAQDIVNIIKSAGCKKIRSYSDAIYVYDISRLDPKLDPDAEFVIASDDGESIYGMYSIDSTDSDFLDLINIENKQDLIDILLEAQVTILDE